MHSVTIDWPDQRCSQNRKRHWREMKTARDRQKRETALLCRHLPKCEHEDYIPVTAVFHFPTKHRRDADNMLSSIKAALDAIAEQIGADDSRFWPFLCERGENVTGGKVEIFMDF